MKLKFQVHLVELIWTGYRRSVGVSYAENTKIQ